MVSKLLAHGYSSLLEVEATVRQCIKAMSMWNSRMLCSWLYKKTILYSELVEGPARAYRMSLR